jgi:hypothetical protein
MPVRERDIGQKKGVNLSMASKKYKFRKLYFQCTNKRINIDEFEFTQAYKRREYAQSNLDSKKRDTRYEWEKDKSPLPAQTVEAFYLVPAALYDQVLKQWVEEGNK